MNFSYELLLSVNFMLDFNQPAFINKSDLNIKSWDNKIVPIFKNFHTSVGIFAKIKPFAKSTSYLLASSLNAIKQVIWFQAATIKHNSSYNEQPLCYPVSNNTHMRQGATEQINK